MKLTKPTLRRRVLGIMFAVFVVAALAFTGILDRVIRESFFELEKAAMVRDATRVEAVLESRIEGLRAVAGDWAERSEASDIVEGRVPRHAGEDFSAKTLGMVGADFVLFLDADDEVRYSIAIDPDTGQEIELNERLAQAVVDLNASVSDPSSDGSGFRGGHVALPGASAAIALQTIANGEEPGEPHGTLILGQFLGEKAIADVSRVSRLSVAAARPVARGSILPRRPHGEGEQLGEVYVEAPDAGTIQSWSTLPGIDGRAALLFVVTEPRTVNEQASKAVAYLGFGLMGGVLLFATTMGITMERVVMRRLFNLHNEVLRISRNDVTNRRLTVDGQDEISDLAMALNRSFDGLAEAEAALKHAADHDHLTGLVNRRRLEEETARALAESERTDGQVAYILLDLDGFKDINDEMGHHCGDAVLVWFAELLSSEVRRYSTVARVGGDEFAIMLPRAGDYEAAVVADRLMTALSENACDVCSGDPFIIGASVGIAVSPRDGSDMGQLTSAADYAMYATKNSRARDCLEPC